MDGDALNELVSFLEAVILDIESALDRFWHWIGHSFFVPGDYILALLSSRAPELAGRLGLAEDAYGGLYAGLLSMLVWLGMLVLVKMGYIAIRDFVGSVVNRVRRFVLVASHRVRMFRRNFGAPIRTLRNSLRANRSGFEEFEIDDLQMAILREQTRLAPGHVITAIDVANDLGVRPLRAQQALDSLKLLHLVEVSFGTTDGYPGYLLTRPGQVFLSACGGNGTLR